ncbi:MAG: S-layer protein [Clostridium sp.]|nr:S-layer protein [Clostridium sp.]
MRKSGQKKGRQMRRKSKKIALTVLAAAVILLNPAGEKFYVSAQAAQSQAGQQGKAAAGPALESESGTETGKEKTKGFVGMEVSQASYAEHLPERFDVNTLKAAEETDHLILAVGDGADQSSLTLWYYERGEDGRLSEVFGTRGTCGQAGITADKKEGDKKTPAGLYSFLMAFGLKDDPGSQISYHKVQEGDCFVDDVGSRYYNQYVRAGEAEADWRSAEVLKNQGPCYNYALVLDYNKDHVPGRGSAIFLHCPKVVNDTYTAGCIGIPEDLMKTVLMRAGTDAKILIVPDKAELSEYTK